MVAWPLQRLFTEAPYRVLGTDGCIQAILYENEPYKGKSTEVFAWMGIPAEARKPVPGMVCVHGGGGRAYREWVEMWVRRGYAAIAMDLSGRNGANERLPNAGPDQKDEDKFSTTLPWEDLWTYHAVAAVLRAHTILRRHPEVNSDRIGVTGISWGGYLTCIAAGVDSRFACAIPVYGCGFLQRGSAKVWMDAFAQMTPEQRQAWHDRCDPSVYLPQATLPMLFLSGTNDFAYSLDILKASYSLPRGSVMTCIRLAMGHSTQQGWAPQEIHWFAEQCLAGGWPLPSLSPCVRDGKRLIAPVDSPTPIERTFLLHTCDRVRWQERKWQISPATLNNARVEATVPDGASACFLAVEDRRGAYVSTPHLEFAD